MVDSDQTNEAVEAAEENIADSIPALDRVPLGPWKRISLGAAIAASLLAPSFLAFVALGSKTWRLAVGHGLGILRNWAPIVIVGAVVIALVALIIQLIKSPRRGALLATLALLLPVLIGWRLCGQGGCRAVETTNP